MRVLVLFGAVLLATGSFAHAQNQPGTLRGVYAPPGLTPPARPSNPTLSAPDYGAVGNGPRVTIPGAPARGVMLPSDVNPLPLPDRPGYGAATVNGRRVIVDLKTNRIFQLLN